MNQWQTVTRLKVSSADSDLDPVLCLFAFDGQKGKVNIVHLDTK